MARTKDPFPMDRGWAWVIVFGCFMCVFFMVGMAKSTGIFLNYFQEYFDVPTSLAAMVMGGSAIVYAVMAPVCIMLAQMFTVRQVVMVGGIIGFIGIALSSLLYSIEYVILSFGICFGLGNATVYGNCLVILGLYFNKRRSLANGLALSGSSLGQFALPPLIELLLDNFGLNGCLLLVGAIYLHITVAGSLFRPISFWDSSKKSPRPSSESRTPLQDKPEETAYNGQLSHTLVNGKVTSCEQLQECAVVGNVDCGAAGNTVTDNTGVEGDSPQTPLISSTPAKTAVTVRNIRNSAGEDLMQDEVGSDQTCPASPVNSFQTEMASVTCGKGDPKNQTVTDHKQVFDVDSSTDPVSVIRNRNSSLLESPTGDRLVSEAEKGSLVLTQTKESERLLGYHSLMTSTGSLCLQPLYGSSIKIEQLQPTQQEVEEKKTSETFCHQLLNMFDFSVMKSYVAVLITISNFLAFFGYFNFVLFLPATMILRGIKKYEKAILVSATGIGDLLGRLTMAFVGDREFIPRYKLQVFGIVAVSINIGILIWADTYWWMIVHCTLYGYFGGIYVSLTAVVIIDFVGLKHLPRVLAVVLLIQGIGASIGQPLLGGVRDTTGSFQGVLAITAACCLLSGLVLLAYPLALKLERRRPERYRLMPPSKETDIVVAEDMSGGDGIPLR